MDRESPRNWQRASPAPTTNLAYFMHGEVGRGHDVTPMNGAARGAMHMQLHPTVQPVLNTLQRKLQKSLWQRGLWGTAERCLAKPFGTARHYVQRLTPTYRRAAASERAFDERYGVETVKQHDLGWLAKIDSPNWQFDAGYCPAPTEPVAELLAGLPIAYKDFVFVDVGSGKGRVLLLAAEHPFKRIIGVEYSERLHSVAVTNLTTAKRLNRLCGNVLSVCQDAAEFVLPNEPLVLFFHHPFGEAVFARIIARVMASLKASPRPLFVIYFDPKCDHLFDAHVFRRHVRRRDEAVVYQAMVQPARA